jgi:hypothetical protein
MRNSIDRRALLRRAGTLATAAAAISTLPALAVASGDDRALIEAEAEITRLYASMEGHPDRDSFEEPWAPIYQRIYALEDFIADTPPATLAGAAVKLRRVLDAETGIETGMRNIDVPSLARVLALVHRLEGEPTHPTRPTSTGDEALEREDGTCSPP